MHKNKQTTDLRAYVISRLTALGYSVFLPVDSSLELIYRDDEDSLSSCLICPLIEYRQSPAVRCDLVSPRRYDCILTANPHRRLVYIVRAHQYDAGIVRLTDSSHILQPSQKLFGEYASDDIANIQKQIALEHQLREDAKNDISFYERLLKNKA